ncbi:MAG: hypothetical protein DRG78_06580 [Epsilonproteobacteria bacterium]|nr:MAG: hypothetical protein DRG78_06580 [Campylobacterota bacterium]
MKTYLNSNTGIFLEDKNADAYIKIFNIQHNNSVSSIKWNEIIEGLNSNDKGKIQLSKAFKDRPEKVLQWIKNDDETITIEIYHLTSDKKWTFQHEYIITIDDIEAFAPIHAYNMNIMQSIKKELTDEALVDTSFLTRQT